jgi:hypothetical protein
MHVVFAAHSTLTPYLAVPLVIIAMGLMFMNRRRGGGDR